MKPARIRFLAVAALCCCAASARAEVWMTSKLTRFGVEFNHPSSFRRVETAREKPGAEGSAAAGNTDTMTDGTMSVTLQAQPGWDRRLFDSQWQLEHREHGSSIDYEVKRDNWYVVSGVEPDGKEFYTKSWLLPDGGFQFKAVYPHARNPTCHAILERMLKGLHPTLTGSDDTSARIGEEKAVRIVADKLKFKPTKNRYLLFEQREKRDGRDYLLVHGYDLVIDSPAGDGHTATWGWYYVDARTGAAYEWDLANDKLLPIKPRELR